LGPARGSKLNDGADVEGAIKLHKKIHITTTTNFFNTIH